MSAAEAVAGGAVLIVDDDVDFAGVLAGALRKRSVHVETATSLESAKAALGVRTFDAAVVDLDLGAESGLDVIPALAASAGVASVVAMSGHASVAWAVEAMRRGAFEFLEKPFAIDRLVAVVARAVERARLVRENARLRALVATPVGAAPAIVPELLGPAMRKLYATVARAAKLDMPVLIIGETGTGKEFVARALHADSPRKDGPWIPVNCGGFQRDLVDSEIFGHEKGAFTGARELRLGLIEVARGGTLFLDEVGELSPDAQVKLLRVIESGEFRRVGSTDLLRADVRIVAATNRELDAEVAAGRFRKDLLFRLDVVPLRLPPLRERKDEIPVFVEAFLRARGRSERSFPGPILDAMRAHDWPGNLRELRNQVDRLLLLGEPGALRLEDLPPPLGGRAEPAPRLAAAPAEGDVTLRTLEQRHIARILADAQWNRREAATRLGIDPRTLYRKLREYGIEEPAE